MSQIQVGSFVCDPSILEDPDVAELYDRWARLKYAHYLFTANGLWPTDNYRCGLSRAQDWLDAGVRSWFCRHPVEEPARVNSPIFVACESTQEQSAADSGQAPPCEDVVEEAQAEPDPITPHERRSIREIVSSVLKKLRGGRS